LKHLALNIFNFYIYFNVHVALSVVALYLIFNQFSIDNYLFFVFFSTVLAYNIIRLFNFKSNRFFIKKFFVKYKNLIFISLLISSLLSIVFYLKLDLPAQFLLIPFLAISFFYNLDFKYAPFLKLRNNGTVKIISVAVVWSGLTVLIPLINSQNYKGIEITIRFLWVLFYVLMLTLSFDQRDLLIDKLHTQTLPQKYSKKLFYIYLFLSIILIVLSMFIFQGKQLFITELIIILSTYLCYRSTAQKSFYYTAFWIEALPVLWLLLLYLVK